MHQPYLTLERHFRYAVCQGRFLPAFYWLHFPRMEWLFGKQKTWVSCVRAKNVVSRSVYRECCRVFLNFIHMQWCRRVFDIFLWAQHFVVVRKKLNNWEYNYDYLPLFQNGPLYRMYFLTFIDFLSKKGASFWLHIVTFLEVVSAWLLVWSSSVWSPDSIIQLSVAAIAAPVVIFVGSGGNRDGSVSIVTWRFVIVHTRWG